MGTPMVQECKKLNGIFVMGLWCVYVIVNALTSAVAHIRMRLRRTRDHEEIDASPLTL